MGERWGVFSCVVLWCVVPFVLCVARWCVRVCVGCVRFVCALCVCVVCVGRAFGWVCACCLRWSRPCGLCRVRVLLLCCCCAASSRFPGPLLAPWLCLPPRAVRFASASAAASSCLCGPVRACPSLAPLPPRSAVPAWLLRCPWSVALAVSSSSRPRSCGVLALGCLSRIRPCLTALVSHTKKKWVRDAGRGLGA